LCVTKLEESGWRWLIRDERALDICESRWLPQPISFRPFTPKSDGMALRKVSELINTDLSYWRHDIIRNIFLLKDVKEILSIALCTSWPQDKLV